MADKISYQDFAASIKSKYPDYKDVDDYTLTQKMLEKYPVYADKVHLDNVSVSQPKDYLLTGVPASPKPLSNDEAKQTIYGNIPGTTKIGNVSFLPIGGNYKNTKDKVAAQPLPAQKEAEVPQQSVYGDTKQVKPMTSTYDENQPVNDYVPNEYEKQQFQQAQTINKGVTEQELNPQFYKDVPQGAINSLASIGGSSLKGAGDLYSKLGKVTDIDFYDSYGKTLQDLGEKANTYAKKNSTGSAGQKIGGILPLAGAAVADIATEGALTPAITGAFAASGYGDGIQMYDEINKGKETNELARTGAGLLYGSVMAGASNFLVGKAIPKGILSDAVQSVFKSNPELLQSGGEAVINSFAKAQPTIVKQLMRNTLHGVGTMETMELSKNAIDELYGKHHDLKDWINTGIEAAVTGTKLSILTSGFSIHAQSKANIDRRNAQGQVTLTFDEKGKPVEVLSGNKGLTPSGKEVKLSEKSLNNAYTLTTEDFNNAIQQHKTEGKATIDDRKVFSNNVANTLNKLSNNGVVTVSHDENGSALYVISPTETGYKAMNTSGELVDIPKESNLEQAHVTDVHQSIMNEYDKQRNAGDTSDNNDNLALALSQPEKIINPDIPEGTDVTDPNVHIQSGIDILDAKQAMDKAMEGTGFQFDSEALNTDPETRKSIVTDIMNDTDFSNEQKQSILNYISTEAKSLKLREADQQSVDTRMQQAQQELEKSINQKTGTLVTVRIKGDEKSQPMPVMNGLAVSTDESKQDNPYIPDVENSDEAVYYIDENGDTQVTTADNLDIVSNTTPEETLSELQNQLVNDYQQRQQVIAEGIQAAASKWQVENGKQQVDNSSKYPVLEDGSPDFEKMTDNQILEHTKETDGEEAAQALAVRQVKRLQAQISENQRNTAKLTEETNKLLAKSKTMQEDKAINAKQSAKGIELSDETASLSAKLKELQAYLPKSKSPVQVNQSTQTPKLRPEIAQLQKEQAAKLVDNEKLKVESGNKEQFQEDQVSDVSKDMTKSEVDTKELDDYISEQEHNSTPTEKQKETGIYAKARVSLQGHNITIETLKGTERSGIDEGGQKWSVTMKNHYGELDGTIGYDGDPIDVFIGPNPKEGEIYVVDQITPQNPSFDESKVMLGFDSAEEAKEAYMSNYEKGWDGFGAITPAGEKFKQWLYDGKKQRKPFAEYKDTPEAVDTSTSSVNNEENKPQSLSDFDFKDEDITKAKKKCIPRPKGGFVL